MGTDTSIEEKTMKFRTLLIGVVATLACKANAQNLLANHSFETEGPGFVLFADWVNFGNVFGADSGELAPQDGLVAAKMFGASNGSQSDQVLNQNVPATEGEQYTLTAYCQNLSTDALGDENIILIQMVFKDAAGNSLETIETNAIDPSSDPQDTWIQSSLAGIAPAGTTNIDVFLLHIQLGADQGFPTQGGGASFWDNISLVSGPPACTNIADLNGDGVLDFFDVSAFLTAFGNGCP